MNTIEHINSKMDLKRYLETHYGRVFKGRKTICPFHDDYNPSMDVEFKYCHWMFYCHACEAKGDVISYLEIKHSKQKKEIMKELWIFED